MRDRLLKGDAITPSKYCFRTPPTFGTGSEKYAWLNRLVCVGVAARTAGGLVSDVFTIRQLFGQRGRRVLARSGARTWNIAICGANMAPGCTRPMRTGARMRRLAPAHVAAFADCASRALHGRLDWPV